MDPFVARRDLQIVALATGDAVRLRTQGLAARDLAEIEIVGLAKWQAPFAASVLNVLADYVANQRPVPDEQNVALLNPVGALVAKFVTPPAEPPPPVTPVPPAYAEGTRVQRIVEPFPGMEHPKTLITTMMLWSARQLLQARKINEARDILRQSLDYFPGDPARRAAHKVGFTYNSENHLTYAAFAELVKGDDRYMWLEKALDRSADLEISLLGDTAEELVALGTEKLADRTRAIIAENAANTTRQQASPDLVLLPCPIRRRAFSNGQAFALQRMAVVPNVFAEYDTALADRTDAVAELVAAIIVERGDTAADLATITADVRLFYEAGNDNAPVAKQPTEYVPGDRAVSMVLTDVARALYAGLSFDELEAHYELAADMELRGAARMKLAALEKRESEAYAAAMKSLPKGPPPSATPPTSSTPPPAAET